MLCACGPRAHIPPRPVVVAGALPDSDSATRLAHRLAPLLYLQRDEWFPLDRAVAVVHPTRPIIAYHLLWHDDVHGAWIPLHRSDRRGDRLGRLRPERCADRHLDLLARQDAARRLAPSRHPGGRRAVGKARLPAARHHRERPARASRRSTRSTPFTSWGSLDILLGRITRPGPSGFFHSYGRYRDFSRVLRLDRLARRRRSKRRHRSEALRPCSASRTPGSPPGPERRSHARPMSDGWRIPAIAQRTFVADHARVTLSAQCAVARLGRTFRSEAGRARRLADGQLHAIRAIRRRTSRNRAVALRAAGRAMHRLTAGPLLAMPHVVVRRTLDEQRSIATTTLAARA